MLDKDVLVWLDNYNKNLRQRIHTIGNTIDDLLEERKKAIYDISENDKLINELKSQQWK